MALSLKAFLGLDGSGFELGMKRAESTVKKFGHTLEDIAKDKVAGLFGLVAIEEGIRRSIEFGHQMSVISERMGISTDDAQKLSYQMDQTGGSVEAAATAFKKLKLAQNEVINGNREFRGYFSKFGINPEDAQSMSAAGLYGRISQFVKNTPGDLSPSQEAAIEKLMGRGGNSLVTSMRANAAELPKDLLIPKETIEKYHGIATGSKNIGIRLRNMIGAASAFTVESLYNTGVLRSMDDPEGRRKEAREYIQKRVGSWGWVKRRFGKKDGTTATEDGEWQGPPRPPSAPTLDVASLNSEQQSKAAESMKEVMDAAKILSTRGRPQIQKDIEEIQTMRLRADAISGGDNPADAAEANKLRFDAYNKVRNLINPFPDQMRLGALQSMGLQRINNPNANLANVNHRLVIVMEQLVAELRHGGVTVPHAYEDTNYR